MKVNIVTKPVPLAKAFSNTLQSVEGQVEYCKLTIVEELLQFMKRHDIKRSELAERMGVVPARITRLLNGTENLTIETLVRAGHAVGADLVQTFVPSGQKGKWVESGPDTQRKNDGTFVSSSLKSTLHQPLKNASYQTRTRKSKVVG